MDNSAKELFQEICDELDIKCTLLSKDWVYMLEKNGKIRFFVGYKSGINDYAVGKILDDKYALYCVLRDKKLPVCEYNIVYNENIKGDYAVGCNSVSYVKEYFYQQHQDIIMKPNKGTCGVDVFRVRDINQLEKVYYQLTQKHDSICISPFYLVQNEYRFIVLDGKVRVSFQKNKPVVYGDGVHSIKELLMAFNYDYFQNKLDNSIYDRVLDKNEEFEYNWKFNLSQGATSSLITDSNLYQELEKIAIKAATSIGLRFGSVDIIVTEDKKALVLEMNSGVMLYSKTKPLYREVLLKLFDDKRD